MQLHASDNLSELPSYSNEPSLKIDENTFFQLYESYWDKLYQIAFKYLNDGFQAEEVVQDLFTSLWQRKDSLLLTESTIENYLVRAVRFKISRIYSDEIRKTQKIDEYKLRQSASSHHTEKQVLYRFLKEDVDKLVGMLPERCKDVYQLSRIKGMNNKEIAVNLLISEKTVENQLTKALNFLRKGLKKYPRS
ncbi:RNA polymerase sigma-70 factor [Pedobacter sp. BAL39]|uniref:RNA polymerase sigma-70 factor n=1 Tax=Pedobacter sp. BAL39 TaxID=391596 RepID=UPI0012F787C4|nr:RNA polymerase sigma-70 factor [Pedobacter sp. BAL39]